MGNSKKRNNRKCLCLNALIRALKKKSEPAVAIFEGQVHFKKIDHKMSPKTTHKFSHLLGYYNSCCCPMQSEQLITIQDLRLEMTGIGPKYPRQYFSLSCLII